MEAEYYPTVMPKIITAADLCKYLEGCVGITATVAQDTVKLLFRVCVRALADGRAGETIGIGLGNLLAVPGRRSVSGAWRPAFRPSRTFQAPGGRLSGPAGRFSDTSRDSRHGHVPGRVWAWHFRRSAGKTWWSC